MQNFPIYNAALQFGFILAGCDTPTQVEGDVGINLGKANPVAKVTAEKKDLIIGTNASNIPVGTYSYVYVSWDAADNVSGYNFYYQEEGKKTVQQPNTGDITVRDNDTSSNTVDISYQQGFGGRVFNETSGSPRNPLTTGPDGSDVDKWYALGLRKAVTDKGTYGSHFNIIGGKKYRFGVRTTALNISTQSTSSDIVWSDYVEF
jgi:hypothetical protein